MSTRYFIWGKGIFIYVHPSSIILTGVGVGVRNDQIEILQLKFAELIGE